MNVAGYFDPTVMPISAYAGAANMNLQNRQQRVDKELKDMWLICDNTKHLHFCEIQI